MIKNSSKLIVVTLAGSLLVTPPTVIAATESNTIEFKWSPVLGGYEYVIDHDIQLNSLEENQLDYTDNTATFLMQAEEFNKAQKQNKEASKKQENENQQLDFSTADDSSKVNMENNNTRAYDESAEVSIELSSANTPARDYTQETTTTYASDKEVDIASDEVEWLRKIVAAEAGNQPYEGKAAVAEVVLNRVKSKKFKQNDVVSIIFAEHQFQPVSNGTIYTAYSNLSAEAQNEVNKAVEDAMEGSNYSEGALFFRADYYFSGRKQIKQIGNHYFSK